ncbi:MAG: TIGR02206 family membrane protein [Acidobacteriota bacterium]|nr:TIGR02206 family membrane protein [Acidobacteriota bacterium]
MPAGLHIFGLVHLAILVTVPAIAALLAFLHRNASHSVIGIRVGLAILIAIAEISYYVSSAIQHLKMFPGHVPLELCDFSNFLLIAALLSLRPLIFDVVYYWALAGASMSLLTPDMVNPTRFTTIQYFADHGLLVATALYLVWSGLARPRPGSIHRSILALNLFAAVVGLFDYFFGTNYMFLRAKPPTASLLDVLGHWPWYIFACEAVAYGLFFLLYLPVRQTNSRNAVAEIDSDAVVQTQTSD